MFSTVPIDLLMEVAKREGYMEQLLLFETPPEYTIDPKYLCTVPVAFDWITSTGMSCGTFKVVDHPAFAALREHLGAAGLIEIERGWLNGDRVMKTFYLNNAEFRPGEKFYSAAAIWLSIEGKNTAREERMNE